MLKIIWVSRHQLSANQLADLLEDLGVRNNLEQFQVVRRNIVWQATSNVLRDREENRAIWNELRDEASVIAGVFPPVALEAKPNWGSRVHVLSPVSRQAPELRVGEGPIPFEHVRWARF